MKSLLESVWDFIHDLPICHHLPERSMLFGFELPLCCRCSGTYLFVLIGIMAGFFYKNKDKSTNQYVVELMVLSILSGIEALMEILFQINPGNTFRFMFGSLSGFAIGMLIYTGITVRK